MRLRTYLGYLAALVAVVVVSFFSVQNRELLEQPFRLWGESRLPLWLVAVVVLQEFMQMAILQTWAIDLSNTHF